MKAQASQTFSISQAASAFYLSAQSRHVPPGEAYRRRKRLDLPAANAIRLSVSLARW